MSKSISTIFFIGIAGILIGLLSVPVFFDQSSLAQSNQSPNVTNSNQSFFPKKDLFTFTKADGYGVYEERSSNVFQPGETIYLYIEPSGFAYKPLQDNQGNILYSIAFSPTAIIYDKDGKHLAGPLEIPNTEIISHYKNKEIFIPFTITQNSPFPPGDYTIKYTITDINSGKSFDIVKNLTISNQNGPLASNGSDNNTKV